MFVQINHDAFARTSLMRTTVRSAVPRCDWCGEQRKAGTLFSYATQSDGYGARIYPHLGLFCSKPCHDTYHAS